MVYISVNKQNGSGDSSKTLIVAIKESPYKTNQQIPVSCVY